ncbi:MAG: LacI family DNA-binding transcriptional regulator, partial [Chthoniobacterales bacterium]
MGRKKGSLAEVQRLSGVSAATVSRVLRGVSGVSDKTRQKVLEAVKLSNYTPNKRLQAHFKRLHSRRYSVQYLINKNYADQENERFFHRMLWPLEKEMSTRKGSLVVSSQEESILQDGST